MKKVFLTILLSFLGVCFVYDNCLAKEISSTFTITPPLVKINMEPGEEFASGIKVINNNDRELTVYARKANFRSIGGGRVEFVNEEEGSEGYTLKEWLMLPQKSFTIAPFKTKNIPYLIKTPKDASPGGHYAGILIGTSPPEAKSKGASIGVSQVLSSLLLVNIEGDIVEKGYIRQFTPNKSVINGDKVEFDVNFENVGNVHLKPVGEVRIYNVFGKEKGMIPMNYKTGFSGNVLPDSQREWRLSWQADDEFIIANRYKAVLTLGFGEKGKQADHREAFFWLINIKMLLIIVGSVIGFFLILFLFIKMYVSQSVKSVQKQIESQRGRQSPQKRRAAPVDLKKKKKPEKKVVDLRNKKEE